MIRSGILTGTARGLTGVPPTVAERDTGADYEDGYNEGFVAGYKRNEAESVALAIANSELRSIILAAEQLALASAPYGCITRALGGVE